MRLASYELVGGESSRADQSAGTAVAGARAAGGTPGVGFGRIEGGRIFPIGTDIAAHLAAGGGASDAAAEAEPLLLEEVRLRAPVSRPEKIICVGLNYRDHAEEAGVAVPEEPILFPKFANSVVGPGDPIIVPGAVRRVDYEAELAVVMGRTCRRVPAEEALDYVAGYTCANDITARELQPKDGQWLRGKAVDTFLPTGPWLVTADEIPDPQGLSIRCAVDGEVLQDSNTAQMVFRVAELISFISSTMTLDAGDLIVTGTPAGVGFVRRPRRWLEPGSTVSVKIEGMGTLTNPVQAEGSL